MKQISVTTEILRTFKDGINGRPQGIQGRENTVACLTLLRAIEKAEGNKYLFVETAEYKFLKDSMEKCPWLSNEKALSNVESAWEAIDAAKQFDPNETKPAPQETEPADPEDQKAEQAAQAPGQKTGKKKE